MRSRSAQLTLVSSLIYLYIFIFTTRLAEIKYHAKRVGRKNITRAAGSCVLYRPVGSNKIIFNDFNLTS